MCISATVRENGPFGCQYIGWTHIAVDYSVFEGVISYKYALWLRIESFAHCSIDARWVVLYIGN